MSDQNEPQEKRAASAEAANAAKEYKAMSDDELLDAMDEEARDAAEASVGKDEEKVQLGSGFSNPLEALAAENTRQEEEIGDLKDKLLRTVAEMENLRRRTQKDVADARNFSITGFARDMLGVADNLRRAINHVDEADKEQPALKSLIEGVEMTERELLNNLEKHGVKKLDPKGEKFDPNYHQAMFEVQNPDVPNNSVMEVVQTGYVIGERVLRPAMVGVAKGGPKFSEMASEANAEEGPQAASGGGA